MPEGDTLFRIAWRLRPILEGQCLVQAETRDVRIPADSLIGRRVVAVECRGKHLLIHADDGRAIHTHLGMTGSWHVYAPGEAWQKPRSRAALSVATEQTVCVCFSPKTLELLSPDGLRRHTHLRQLGPDILATVFDAEDVRSRFRLRPAVPVGEAIMNQTIMCGVGNIYKSETLFQCRMDPFIAVAQLTDERLLQVIEVARRLMRANLYSRTRRTRHSSDGQPFWVYGRSSGACFVCGEQIRMRHQGELGRSTYWCPTCQRS
jgi:endonuclease-8